MHIDFRLIEDSFNIKGGELSIDYKQENVDSDDEMTFFEDHDDDDDFGNLMLKS